MIRYRRLNESAYLTKLVFKNKIERLPYEGDGLNPSRRWEEYEVYQAVALLGGIKFTFNIDKESLSIFAEPEGNMSLGRANFSSVVGTDYDPSRSQRDMERKSMEIWKDINDVYEECSLDKISITEIFEKHGLTIY